MQCAERDLQKALRKVCRNWGLGAWPSFSQVLPFPVQCARRLGDRYQRRFRHMLQQDARFLSPLPHMPRPLLW
jgi:hypothetical protein